MSAEVIAPELKVCSGCGNPFPVGDFPVTTARGRRLVRTKCVDCLRAYYRRYVKFKRGRERKGDVGG